MIEIKNDILSDGDNPMDKKPIEKEKYTEKVVASVTTSNIDMSKFKVCKCLEVSDIYNDDGVFVIEVNSDPIPTLVRVSRDLMKKVIYDIYLK
jgi:hypothetical protein